MKEAPGVSHQSSSMLQRMSVNPLLRLKGNVHQRLQVAQTKRGAVSPDTGLMVELSGENRCEERAFSPTFCQIVALLFLHRSVVAGHLDELLFAIRHKETKRTFHCHSIRKP